MRKQLHREPFARCDLPKAMFTVKLDRVYPRRAVRRLPLYVSVESEEVVHPSQRPEGGCCDTAINAWLARISPAELNRRVKLLFE